ncbi:MAG: glycosyltransferase [Thermodesulfovibrionia bacterium]|nr:glycosyltransferase [Thermodesulfovibrionia bacterium]
MKLLIIDELSKNNAGFLMALQGAELEFFDASKSSQQKFSHRSSQALWSKISAGVYDAIIIGHIGTFSDKGYISRQWANIKWPNAFIWQRLIKNNKPNPGGGPAIVAINLSDSPAFTVEDTDLLLSCDLYFKRELPQNVINGFINIHTLRRTSIASYHFLKNRGAIDKLRPISVGIDPEALPDHLVGSEKKYDLFFAGMIHPPMTVRNAGLPIIQLLKEQGLRIYHPEKPIPRELFLQKCAQSYLVWSPEGGGWDCYRHYEATMAGSVPVINYPTIRRYAPLVDGQHALYYGCENDHLAHVVLKALQDKARLVEMGHAAHEHVRRFHTYQALARYVADTIKTHCGI